MKLIGVVRSSTQDVAEGYGPVNQEAEIVSFCYSNNHELVEVKHLTEQATINIEDRTLFRSVIDEAKELRTQGKCDGLIFGRCDRLSRNIEGAIQVAIDFKKFGLTIVLVRENHTLKPDDEPIKFVMFVLQAFSADSQTRTFLKNTHEGQRSAAKAGKLPSGVGRRGLFGYNLVGYPGEKRFEPDAKALVVDEVLQSGLEGNSINSITRTLQNKGVDVTRDTVRKILSHARVYAGIYRWGGVDIPGLVPPRITLEQADIIEINMKRNRERSYGFGKRKWLSGHIFCGVCGRRYALEMGKKGCHCRGKGSLEHRKPCDTSPQIKYQRLENAIMNLLIYNLAQPEIMETALNELRRDWGNERNRLLLQLQDIETQKQRTEDKRERILWQHSEGLISGSELKEALQRYEPQLQYLEEKAKNLQNMVGKPAPPDTKTVGLLGRWVHDILGNFMNEDSKSRVAEACDLKVTVLPAKEGPKLQLSANVPLEVAGVEFDAQGQPEVMVCSSPPRR